MPQYSVMIDDNWQYMDAVLRLQYGPFSTADEAVAACRKIVDDWLELYKEPGMTAGKSCTNATFASARIHLSFLPTAPPPSMGRSGSSAH